MSRPPRLAAFTLIEMIMVIALVAILAGFVLLIYPLVKQRMALGRATTEIRTLSGALENYKTDFGGYPQAPTKTDALDARNVPASKSTGAGSLNAAASLYLYECLTGDANDNGIIDAGETARNYAPDFFKPSRLYGPQVNGQLTSVQYVKDSWGNSFGYSTAGLLLEQEYRAQLATDPHAARPPVNSRGTVGYNPTFDLWTTAGDMTGDANRWAKNW